MAFLRSEKNNPVDQEKKADNLYERLVSFVGDGVYSYFCNSGRLIFSNKGFLDILDLDMTPEQAKGKKVSELLVYSEKPGTLREKLIRDGEIHDFEYELKTLKGDRRYLVYDAFLGKDPSTGEKTVEAIVRDVTQERLYDKKIQHLNAILKAVWEINQLIINKKNPSDLVDKVTEVLVDTGGYQRAWIVLLDEDEEHLFSSGAGDPEMFPKIFKETESGENIRCLERTLELGVGKIFAPGKDFCKECSMLTEQGEWMLTTLKHVEKVYGVIAVNVSDQVGGIDEQDRSIFIEMASDMSLALHDTELSQEKEEREKELLSYRTHLEQLVEQRRSQLEMIGEAIPYGVWICNAEGGVEYLSDSFLDLLGMTKEEARKHGWTRALRPEKVDKAISDWKECIRSGSNWNYEHEVRGKDGKWYTVLSIGFPVRDDEGEISSWAGINLDITQRKAYERKIRRSEEYFKKIINSVADPIFVKDRDHSWIMLNEAFCEFMGYSHDELIGKSDYDFFPKSEADVFWAKDEEVFKSGEENVNEEKITDSSGTTHTIITKKKSYIDEKGDKILVGVIRNISERKEMEEELKESESRYRSLFEENPSATILVGEDLTVKMVNRRFELLLGFSREEIIGKSKLTDFIEEQYEDKVRRYHQLRMIDASAPPSDYEVIAKTSSGGHRHVIVNIAVVPYTRRSMVSFIDVTELKDKEFELNKQKEIMDTTNTALEHKLKELEGAMKHIKRLEGLVPICASCKKMLTESKGSDKPGAWVPLEEYISERSEAKFTHGLCPECIAELYGSSTEKKKKE